MLNGRQLQCLSQFHSMKELSILFSSFSTKGYQSTPQYFFKGYSIVELQKGGGGGAIYKYKLTTVRSFKS